MSRWMYKNCTFLTLLVMSVACGIQKPAGKWPTDYNLVGVLRDRERLDRSWRHRLASLPTFAHTAASQLFEEIDALPRRYLYDWRAVSTSHMSAAAALGQFEPAAQLTFPSSNFTDLMSHVRVAMPMVAQCSLEMCQGFLRSNRPHAERWQDFIRPKVAALLLLELVNNPAAPARMKKIEYLFPLYVYHKDKRLLIRELRAQKIGLKRYPKLLESIKHFEDVFPLREQDGNSEDSRLDL